MDENPNEPPQTHSSPARPSRKNEVAIWSMGVLSVPAGLVAFGLACTATHTVINPVGVSGPAITASFIVGGIVGATVMGLMLYVAVFRKPKH
jgi:hypothetical protein